jgi:DNA topoisomerase-1
MGTDWTVEGAVDNTNRDMAKEFGIRYQAVRHHKSVTKLFDDIFKCGGSVVKKNFEDWDNGGFGLLEISVTKLFSQIYKEFVESGVKRDPKGRFANKYGNMKEGRLASAMSRAVKTSGGFTLDDRTGKGLTDGYSVGVFPEHSGTFDAKEFTKQKAKAWLAQNRRLIKDPRIMVGGWHDTETGKVWLDLVRIYPKHQKDIALGVGRKRNQIAIADLEAISRGDWDNAIINTGGDGLTKAARMRFFLLRGDVTPEELVNAVQNRTIAKLFSQLYKAFDESKVKRDQKGKFSTKTGIGTGVTQDKDKTWRNSKGEEAHPDLVARAKELRIPPAWRDVRVNPDRNAGLAAVGFDAKGRKTALYTEKHHEAQAVKKFARLKKFTAIRDDLVQKAAKDAAGGNDDAAVLLLLAKTGMRIGSHRDTGAKVQAYGASTLQARHIKVTGSVTGFEFVGKKGVNISLTSLDAPMARVLKERMKGKGENDQVFNTTDAKVRDYMHSIGGKGFMPKDFRTYVATSTALDMVKSLKPAAGEKEFKTMRLMVAKKVSSLLGNTPAMAISSYIDPAVWHHVNPLRKSA